MKKKGEHREASEKALRLKRWPSEEISAEESQEERDTL